MKLIVASCGAPVISSAKKRWPRPFADLAAEEELSRKRDAERDARREAERQARQPKKVEVAKLIEILDAGDGPKLKALLGMMSGGRLHLDNGEAPAGGDVIRCFNAVLAYRRERQGCGSPNWFEAGCVQRVFTEGKWREHADGSNLPQLGTAASPLSYCGFRYPAFEKEIAGDLDLVRRFEQRQASFQKYRGLQTQKLAAMDQLAKAAAQKQPDVIRAGFTDSLCDLHSKLDGIAKQEALQRKIDQESGTVDPKARRALGTAKVLVNEQVSKAKREYIRAGGRGSDAKQTSMAFWCSRPKQAAVMESARHANLRAQSAKRPTATTTCSNPDWKELAAAVSGSDVFKTCLVPNIANQKEPVPEPHWAWLRDAKRTGEEFVYALALGDDLSLMVFQFAANKWTLVRTESCSYAGGDGCDELGEFTVGARGTP